MLLDPPGLGAVVLGEPVLDPGALRLDAAAGEPAHEFDGRFAPAHDRIDDVEVGQCPP